MSQRSLTHDMTQEQEEAKNTQCENKDTNTVVSDTGTRAVDVSYNIAECCHAALDQQRDALTQQTTHLQTTETHILQRCYVLEQVLSELRQRRGADKATLPPPVSHPHPTVPAGHPIALDDNGNFTLPLPLEGRQCQVTFSAVGLKDTTYDLYSQLARLLLLSQRQHSLPSAQEEEQDKDVTLDPSFQPVPKKEETKAPVTSIGDLSEPPSVTITGVVEPHGESPVPSQPDTTSHTHSTARPSLQRELDTFFPRVTTAHVQRRQQTKKGVGTIDEQTGWQLGKRQYVQVEEEGNAKEHKATTAMDILATVQPQGTERHPLQQRAATTTTDTADRTEKKKPAAKKQLSALFDARDESERAKKKRMRSSPPPLTEGGTDVPAMKAPLRQGGGGGRGYVGHSRRSADVPQESRSRSADRSPTPQHTPSQYWDIKFTAPPH